MSDANPSKFRADMKTYLDKAEKAPVRIHRRSGASFVLMNEENYRQMQEEILSLQRRLLGMSQILGGESQEHERHAIEARLARFETSPVRKKKRA